MGKCEVGRFTIHHSIQVKNVTGRLLVGLRWWNEANESGSAWRFEQASEGRQYNNYEKRLFWIGLAADVVAWALLFVLEVFRLKFGE